MTPDAMRAIADTLELVPRAVAKIPGVITKTADNARGHSRRRGYAIARQREGVRRVLEGFGWHYLRGKVRVCRVTRIAPRPVDPQNLASALKVVIDGVADAVSPVRRKVGKRRREVGEDGPASGIHWAVHYEPGPAGVRIEVWL